MRRPACRQLHGCFVLFSVALQKSGQAVEGNATSKKPCAPGVALLSWMSHSFRAAVPWQCSWKGAVKCAQKTEGLRKSWKIGVMPNFLHGLSFLLSLPPPSFSPTLLCDKYQMLGPFSRRHDAFFFPLLPSLMTFVFHLLKPQFPFCRRPDEPHHQRRPLFRCLLIILSADDRYWVFREADVLPGYPQPLRQYGQGVPAHKIDTAIWWEPSGYTYFFSGDRCPYLLIHLFLGPRS